MWELPTKFTRSFDFKEIEKLNAVILGVSPDSVKSHDKFINKFKLPFTLLADEDKKMCQDYGVWVEKSMYGKKYMGVARTTFIIDKSSSCETWGADSGASAYLTLPVVKP